MPCCSQNPLSVLRLTGVIPPSKAATAKQLQAAKDGASRGASQKESRGGVKDDVAKENEEEASKAKLIRLTAEQVILFNCAINGVSFM